MKVTNALLFNATFVKQSWINGFCHLYEKSIQLNVPMTHPKTRYEENFQGPMFK